MTGSSKKGIEVEKSKKHTFSLKSLFVNFFVKRSIFGYNHRGAVVAAVNLI